MRHDFRTGFEKAKPVLDAVFASKSKQTPYFAAYIERASRMPSRLVEDAFLGCGAGIIGTAALIYAAYSFIEGRWGIGLSLIIGYPALLAAAGWAVSRLRGPRTPRDRRLASLRKAASTMKPFLHGRRLSKSLGSATATLLEESARNWMRASTALNDPFWTRDNLPNHWRNLRAHSLEAVDDAMGDLVLITHPYMKPITPKTDWQEVVGNVVGGFLGVQPEHDDEPLPPVFGAARDISEKLKLLASEVEQATRQVVKEQPDEETVPSATSLDACLNELKSIQQAEGELKQNLRG